ncbi:MAG: META domain-containing protein [Muribaculum sp.]
MKMNIKSLNIIACLAIATAFSTSCSVFNKNKSTANTTAPKTETVKSPVSTGSQASVPVENLGGEWTIYTVGGNKVTGENRPYINFSMDDHRIYGSNGCNIINGDFATPSGTSLKISNVISTMMACPDAKFEQAINKGLDAVRSYSLVKKGHEFYLDLKNSNGVTVMTLRKHNMDFLNGTWEVKSINGKEYNNPDMEMVIDIQEQKLHGNSGCNIMNGSLSINPDKSNSIQFLDIATTRMMCPEANMKAETALLVALESVEYAKKGKNDTVIMSDKNDQPIIILKKVDVNR